ncbi:MAG: response regulator, partial [Candidatus Brocadiae bacterium]|nr:response regulator [Candidatus Brocadiia bacterium]
QKLPARREDRTVPCGSETILIAEDERAVLDVARRTLEAQGYTVLAAARPEVAEVLFARHLDEVALLLADVVMPVCSGRALYERLTAERPLLKVLYMSGYTGNAVVRHGVLNRSTPFIQKPFSPDTLARKVRAVLEG